MIDTVFRVNAVAVVDNVIAPVFNIILLNAESNTCNAAAYNGVV